MSEEEVESRSAAAPRAAVEELESRSAAAPRAAMETLRYAAPPNPDRAATLGGATLFHVASLGIKLLGIYALIQLSPYVTMIPAAVFGWRSMDAQDVLVAGVLPLGYALVGVLLIAFSRSIAARLTGPAAELTVLSGGRTARRMQAVAFSVVAVFVVLAAVPQLAAAAWELAYQRDERASIAWSLVAPSLLPAAAQIALGVWLFVGSRGLARMWRRFQRRDGRGL